ncbi:MAG TPA: hypothetical protein DDZ39_09055 [Flavobacteriaceae bacterium]|nr:hypothetical protein [Flavobacteriaceae bacterium]
MEEQKSSSNKKIIIIALLALLAALGVYTMRSNSKFKEAESFLKEEKKQILSNLTSMEEKYDTAIAQNNSMSEELTIERDRIIAFKDSVTNLKNANWSLIRRYKGQIGKLEATNSRLMAVADSLFLVNNDLTIQRDSITGKLIEQTSANDTLMAQNTDLAAKVKIGGALRANSIKAMAMRLRGNGKFTETSKAQKAEAIRVTFRIEANEIAIPGDKDAFIVIQNPSGKVISEKGTFTLRNGKDMPYTDKTVVPYKNAEEDVVMFVENITQKFVKGTYSVKVYVEGNLVGATRLELKDAFLGL